MKEAKERTRSSRPIPPRDGSKLIKGFVRQSEQRRVACRFSRAGRGFTPRPPGHQHAHAPRQSRIQKRNEDDRQETRSATPASFPGNQEEENTAAIVGGLFTSKAMLRNRQISLTPAMLPAATAAAASGLGANNKPIFTFTRRKLQMESIFSQSAPVTAMMLNPSSTSQPFGHRSRVSTLAAKLDSILRSSPWMRRKVVLQPQMNSPSQRGFSNVSSPRLLPQVHEAINTSSGNSNERHYRTRRKKGYNLSDEDSKEMEKRIMATFRRFVRLWRERKRRSEQAALSIVTGNGGAKQNNAQSPTKGSNTLAGRQGSKLRRELDAQSSNVASILSRRMIGEVPALKFFDEIEPLAVEQSPREPFSLPSTATVVRGRLSDTEDEEESSSPTSPVRTIGDMMASLSLKDGGLRSSPVRRATPRGVCYTLDASGCRRIKMQSGTALQMNKTVKHTSQNHQKSEEMTIERATSKSLRRKMIRRVKVKHRAISMLTDDFAQSKKALTAKLGSQLALRQAESESTFGKRLSLHLSNNVELPPHMTSKEFALARLRFKKANLQACCQTLALLGAALHHVETAGEVSGREISAGEQRFLQLLRCAVEGDHALTPLLLDGIRGQFNPEQRQKPLVAGLLSLLEKTTVLPTPRNLRSSQQN
ncbi:hypothetical protein GN244_ATG14680 [Phytophthora infestans]|uniref:Uncharacterized protein n=1 Tax=Phytophthora infestans TaxID=4787 RepID=A0A833SW08_PHYIN|nr:hypothetical protein GN244_ATG14680 [Phytophthora infestans]KAF4133719.1 hypothetical protein GN958_ATG17056 [Phytophthora infestans]KAI9989593.1 hypothetical protein PInf_019878 [Phytophthora infestans]